MTGYYSARKGATEGNELIYRPWGGGTLTQIPGGLSAGAGMDVSRDGKRLALSTCRERSKVARLTADQPAAPIASGAWQDTTPRVAGHYLYVTSDRQGPTAGWRIDLDGKEPARSVSPEHALARRRAPMARGSSTQRMEDAAASPSWSSRVVRRSRSPAIHPIHLPRLIAPAPGSCSSERSPA
jgi:hypothetical protein